MEHGWNQTSGAEDAGMGWNGGDTGSIHPAEGEILSVPRFDNGKDFILEGKSMSKETASIRETNQACEYLMNKHVPKPRTAKDFGFKDKDEVRMALLRSRLRSEGVIK